MECRSAVLTKDYSHHRSPENQSKEAINGCEYTTDAREDSRYKRESRRRAQGLVYHRPLERPERECRGRPLIVGGGGVNDIWLMC